QTRLRGPSSEAFTRADVTHTPVDAHGHETSDQLFLVYGRVRTARVVTLKRVHASARTPVAMHDDRASVVAVRPDVADAWSARVRHEHFGSTRDRAPHRRPLDEKPRRLVLDPATEQCRFPEHRRRHR